MEPKMRHIPICGFVIKAQERWTKKHEQNQIQLERNAYEVARFAISTKKMNFYYSVRQNQRRCNETTDEKTKPNVCFAIYDETEDEVMKPQIKRLIFGY